MDSLDLALYTLALCFLANVALAPVPAQAPRTWQQEPDPFRRCGRKAVAGEVGDIPEWKLRAYKRGLEQGIRVAGVAWVTHYTPGEGFYSGKQTASGAPVSKRVAAANEIPMGSYVWIYPGEMRQVLDRGAKRNDRVARHKGADLWIDLWTDNERLRNATDFRLYAVIDKEG